MKVNFRISKQRFQRISWKSGRFSCPESTFPGGKLHSGKSGASYQGALDYAHLGRISGPRVSLQRPTFTPPGWWKSGNSLWKRSSKEKSGFSRFSARKVPPARKKYRVWLPFLAPDGVCFIFPCNDREGSAAAPTPPRPAGGMRRRVICRTRLLGGR